MTKEDKELLLKDLCARVHYNNTRFKIGDYSDYKLIGIVITDEHPIKVEVIENGISYKVEVSAVSVKPYLRPMSSMTEEEEIEYDATFVTIKMSDGHYDSTMTYKSFDWLNAHHFDYRGLIEKGLAIEVTEENNP